MIDGRRGVTVVVERRSGQIPGAIECGVLGNRITYSALAGGLQIGAGDIGLSDATARVTRVGCRGGELRIGRGGGLGADERGGAEISETLYRSGIRIARHDGSGRGRVDEPGEGSHAVDPLPGLIRSSDRL